MWKIFGPQFRLSFVISRLLRCSPLIVQGPMFNFHDGPHQENPSIPPWGSWENPHLQGPCVVRGGASEGGYWPRINPPTRKWRRTTIYKPCMAIWKGTKPNYGYLVRNDSCCWDDPPKKWTWTSPTPPLQVHSSHFPPSKSVEFVRWRMGGMVCNRAEGCQCFWSLATFKKGFIYGKSMV